MVSDLRRRLTNVHALLKQYRDFAQYGLMMQRRAELQRLRNEERYLREDRLAKWGFKIYSQHEEDGMLAEIFRRIGYESRFFVEFGVGDGLENNTLALLMQDWRGIWIEGDERNVNDIQKGLPLTIASGQLSVRQAFITRENIDDLIRAEQPPSNVDLLSIDIDGNDFHVWDRIRCIAPRVVVIEYNPKFPPPVRYCMQYDASHRWDLSDHCGASLSFLEQEFRARGYSIVGCDITGTNAFFVRTDIARAAFHAPFTAEFHYEPARFDLISVPSGHRASYRTIETRMRFAEATPTERGTACS